MLLHGERLRVTVWVVLGLVVVQATLYLLFFYQAEGGGGSHTRCVRTDVETDPGLLNWEQHHRSPNYTCTVGRHVKRTRERFVSPEEVDMASGLKVLVTGGAGFIASHVARYCASELGMDVVVVDNLSGGFLRNLPYQGKGPKRGSITFVKGDLRDTCFIEFLFTHHGPFEYVYHLAAYAAEGLSSFIRRFNYHNNLVSSSDLLSKSVNHNVKCFIFTSSIAVYGPNQLPMTEDTVPQPEDPYGISKYAMELDLKAAKVNFDMDYIIFRPHNVYGPGQNIADKYRNVIGIFINQILRGEDITIFGDGLQTRAFSYIEDVAPVIAVSPFVRAARNQVFNVGADQPYTLLELATSVKDAMGVPEHPVRHLPARHEVKDAYSDHSKTRCFFKTPTATDLQTGLKEMVAWVKSLKEDYTPVEFDEAVEVTKNMPPSWLANMMDPAPFKIMEVQKLKGDLQHKVATGLTSLATKGFNDQAFTCLAPKPPLRRRAELESKGKRQNDLLLVLTTCNIWTKTELCLHSLSRIQDEFDLLVVDDQSTDDTVTYLKNMKIPYIQPPAVKGLTYSWNMAYKYAVEKGYPYMIIANNDILVPNGVIDKLHYILTHYAVAVPMSTQLGAGHVHAQGMELAYGIKSPEAETFLKNPLNYQKVQQLLDEVSEGTVLVQSTNAFNGFFFGLNMKRIAKAEHSPGVLFDPKNVNIGNELDLYGRMTSRGLAKAVARCLSTFVFHYKSSTFYSHIGCKNGQAGKPCKDAQGDWRENLNAFHPKK